MLTDEDLNTIQKMIDKADRVQPRQKIIQSDIPPQTIKKRHIEDVVIVFGVLADRPTDSSTGVRAYFAMDNNTLYCWNGTAWVSEVLS
jgi:hypothetical protein